MKFNTFGRTATVRTALLAGAAALAVPTAAGAQEVGDDADIGEAEPETETANVIVVNNAISACDPVALADVAIIDSVALGARSAPVSAPEWWPRRGRRGWAQEIPGGARIPSANPLSRATALRTCWTSRFAPPPPTSWSTGSPPTPGRWSTPTATSSSSA